MTVRTSDVISSPTTCRVFSTSNEPNANDDSEKVSKTKAIKEKEIEKNCFDNVNKRLESFILNKKSIKFHFCRNL